MLGLDTGGDGEKELVGTNVTVKFDLSGKDEIVVEEGTVTGEEPNMDEVFWVLRDEFAQL